MPKNHIAESTVLKHLINWLVLMMICMLHVCAHVLQHTHGDQPLGSPVVHLHTLQGSWSMSLQGFLCRRLTYPCVTMPASPGFSCLYVKCLTYWVISPALSWLLFLGLDQWCAQGKKEDFNIKTSWDTSFTNSLFICRALGKGLTSISMTVGLNYTELITCN